MVSGGSSEGNNYSGSYQRLWTDQANQLNFLWDRSNPLVNRQKRLDEAAQSVMNPNYRLAQQNLRKELTTSADASKVLSGKNYGMQTLADLQGNYKDPALRTLGKISGRDPLRFAGYMNPNTQKLQDTTPNLGMEKLDEVFMSGPNPYLEDQVKYAQDLIAENLTRNILPSIRKGGIAAGQYGGSREGIASGIAMSDAQKAATNAATQMYSQAYETDMNRKLQAANIYSNMAEAQKNRAINAANLGMQENLQNANIYQRNLQNQLAAATGAGSLRDAARSKRLSAADRYAGYGVAGQSAALQKIKQDIDLTRSMYNLGIDPYKLAWLPYLNQRQLIGAPAILGRSSGYGSSESMNFGIL